MVGCGGGRPRPDGRDHDRDDGRGGQHDGDKREYCRKTYENWKLPRPAGKLPNRIPDRKVSSLGNASGLFGYVSPAPTSVFSVKGGDCPDVGGCGLNGSWLGSGVQFRTLHLTAGVPNEQGLQIKEFRKGSELLRIDVRGQELLGYSATGTVLQGAALVGAQLLIEHVTVKGDIDRTYTLTIEPPAKLPPNPDYTQFWAKCNDPGCVPTPELYTFSAMSSDGCEVRICKPGLADDFAGSLKGTAVIFRGDLYDDDTYTVSNEPPATYNGDVFNIACVGTSISKLHLLRHTVATGHPAHTVPPAERTTMLKLFAADYCGIGVPFTEDGLPIKLAFNSPDYTLTDVGYIFTQPNRETIDAAWTPTGAACIGTSRVGRIPPPQPEGISGTDPDALRTQINAICNSRHATYPSGRTNIPNCTTVPNGPVTPSTLFPPGVGNYATSGNP
jgi:hypothetical protein